MKRRVSIWALLALLSGLTGAMPALAADPPPAPVSTTDPKYISAKAEELKAQNDRLRAEVEAKLAASKDALQWAQAAHEWAVANYIRELQRILIAEYEEIQKQQARVQRLIEEVRWNDALAQRISMGHIDRSGFQAMMRLIAGSTEFDAIRDVLNKKVDPLPATENFVLNDTEEGIPQALKDFPGGDIRKLLLFLKTNNFSLIQLGDAHWQVLDGLAAIRRTAENRIMKYEQEIQAVRASRIAEVFIPPK